MVTYDARPSPFTQLTTISDWEYMTTALAGISGIDVSVGGGMAPSLDTGGRNAVITDGVCVIKGQLWRADAPVSTPIPAASAQNRIDRLVLRLTRGATTSPTVVAPFIITGTPGGSPTIPPVTQTLTGIWDLPVCHWTSTSAGAITSLVDDRMAINDQWHDMRPLQNQFIGSIAGNAPPQYRFSSDLKFVEVAGYVQTPPATGNYNAQAFFTFPSAYRPQTPQGHRWLITGAADGTASPCVVVYPAGNIQFYYLPGSLGQTVVGIYGRYPIDSQAGFLLT